MCYLYNSEEEIIQLKKNLMSKTGKSPLPSIGKKEQTNDNKTVDSSFVSNEIRRILNTFKGEKFESNMVETLKC